MLNFDSLVVPVAGVQDAPNRCYRLNNEWAKRIMGLVSLLTETPLWKDAYEDDHPGIIGVMEFLIGEDCGVIDCSEIEDCLGTSDTLTAIEIGLYSNLRTNTQTYLDTLTSAYDGTPQSIDPDIPLTAPSADPDHDTALCYALEFAVANYAATKRAEISLVDGWSDAWQAVLSALRGVFKNIPANLMYLLGDELYGCVASFSAAILALESDVAKTNLACCLYSTLRGAPVTEAAYNTALTACAGSLSGLSADLSCLMLNDNGVDHALTFFVQYGQALERIAAGETLPCTCTGGWAYEIDFTAGLGLWVLHQGTFVPGVGVQSSSGTVEGLQVYLDTAAPYVWSHVEAEYTRVSDGSFLDDFRVIVSNDVPTLLDRYNWIEINDPAPGGLVVHCASNPAPPARTSLLVVLRDNNIGATMVLKRIKVYSTGEVSPPAPLIDNAVAGCT